MRDHYLITELTREFGITTRALRFYESEGLLTPTRDGRKRLFTAFDRHMLRIILRGKSIGLTLNELKEILIIYKQSSNTMSELEGMMRMIELKRAQLRQKRKNIEDLIHDLDKAEESCIGKLVEMRVGS